MGTSQHVVPNRDGRWAVRRSGASRASRLFQTQKDAVEYARVIARRERAALYVHRGDGTIRDRDSYGADPMPAKH